jgi:hypothetical protein
VAAFVGVVRSRGGERKLNIVDSFFAAKREKEPSGFGVGVSELRKS